MDLLLLHLGLASATGDFIDQRIQMDVLLAAHLVLTAPTMILIVWPVWMELTLTVRTVLHVFLLASHVTLVLSAFHALMGLTW